MFSKRINKWFNGIKQYMFFYRDGFFEFYYLSDSPHLMVESLIHMPFTKHNQLEQVVYSKTPFMKGAVRYREIEDGLWLIATEAHFTVNVHTKALYDKNESDYYFLSFSIYQTEVKLQNTMINKISFPSRSWSLYRPGTEIDAYHFKGTKGLFFNFAFSKSWAERNLSFSQLPDGSGVKKFLDSDTGFICWEDDLVPEGEALAMDIWKNMIKENNGHFDSIILKINTLRIVTDFFKNTLRKKLPENYIPLSESDRRNITQAEKILKEHLPTTFPGIEYIAKQVHMSPTKLKSTFKSFYSTSLLQYYNQNKMVLAQQLIKETDIPIKSIALSAGYESAGKFSAAYKKQFGIYLLKPGKTNFLLFNNQKAMWLSFREIMKSKACGNRKFRNRVIS